jgi:radical SAM superfamily enzyme YgiQ (UPF0313 family)
LAKNNIFAKILDPNNIFYNLSEDGLKKQWRLSCNARLEENILPILKKNHPGQYRELLEKMSSFETVGFSCFKSNFQVTLETAKWLKSKSKNIKIILGGPEITRQFFKTKGRFSKELLGLANLLVVGEGEKALLDYLQGKNKNKVVQFDQLNDLSKLPFPLYPGLGLDSYPRQNAVPLQFSRGCVKRCAFCSEKLLYRGLRTRGTESVIEEIKFHREKTVAKYFVFYDSMLNAQPDKLEDLCAGIIDNFGSINWEAQIAIRNDMAQALFEKMKRSGCYNLFIGLESGSDRTLKKMNKGFTAKEALGFFKKLKKAGLFFGISIIVGYPGETEADFRDSLDFVMRNIDLIPKIEQVNPFAYYDGTSADRRGDYKLNQESLRRMEVFTSEIKRAGFKYTNAFLGNLVEKYAGV